MARQDRLGPQLPLALRYPPDQRFQTWVGGAATTASLQALVAGTAAESLYLQGAGGSGKTHLLLAACAAAEAAGRHAAYVSLARVCGHARDALDGLEQADVVAIDDLDAAAGHADDEVALFDLHNRVRDAGVGLVYAARDVPTTLGIVLPDLRSRLAHCTLVALRSLDDAGRAEVLRRRASTRGLQVDDAALDWLLTRCSRDLSTLSDLFERLDRASLAEQRRLTVPFLRQVLGSD